MLGDRECKLVDMGAPHAALRVDTAHCLICFFFVMLQGMVREGLTLTLTLTLNPDPMLAHKPVHSL